MRRDRFFRLTLSRDLALRAFRHLDGPRHGAEAIQAVVLVDLAIEIATRTAIEVLQRTPTGDRFKDLMSALPELSSDLEGMRALHEVRNSAQHRGVVPPDAVLPGLRLTAAGVLQKIFALSGADFDTFSSVEQLQTEHFKRPLSAALTLVRESPADAGALAARALQRFHGWAAYSTGEALIPEEMWVFGSGLWNDLVLVSKCADNREDFIKAMLYLNAGSSMGIPVPAMVRFLHLGHGHAADDTTDGFTFRHAEDATTITSHDAAWMIETVARSVARLEEDWPDLLLVPAADDSRT